MQKTGRAVFASTVVLINLDDNTKFKYKIVGEDEAELKEGKISIKSPLARSIIGKEKGDVIELKLPDKTIEYEIKEVNYE